MKIIIDSRALTKDVGSGVGWYTKQLIESLAKYTDLEVKAWYNTFKKSSLDKILPTFDLPVQPVEITGWPNQLLRTIWKLPLANLLPIDRVLSMEPRISWTFYSRLLPKYPVDVFHAPSPIYGLPPAKKIKRVVTVHDLTFLTHPETHAKADLVMKKTIQKTVNEADAIIAVSKNTEKDLIELLNVPEEKIQVVYEAPREIFKEIKGQKSRVETCLEEFGVKKPYFLYVGNLEPRKNLTRLIQAFEKFQLSNDLNTSPPTYRLVLAGGQAWHSKKIIQTVKNSPVREKIVLTGYVSDEDLVVLYNNAQALFYVPLYEGFGLPILEALACGCLVVTSNTSSLPEVGGKVAEYVDPKDAEEIAHKMAVMANWPQEIRDTKQKIGFKWVQDFSWQKVAKETKRVYQNLFSNV